MNLKIKEYWLGLAIGSSGWIVFILYLFHEYSELGGFSGLLSDIISKDPRLLFFHVMIVFAPVASMYFGYITEKKIGLQKELNKSDKQLRQELLDREKAQKACKISEEKYRSFFEHDLTGDFISTPSGQLIDCNPAFLEIIGCRSLDEAKSVGLNSIYPMTEKFLEMVDRVRKEKKIVNYEHKMLKINGDIIFVNENVVGEFDEQDKLVKMRGYLIEITERKKAEESLKESEDKFRSLAEQSPNMIFINQRRRIVYVNKRCEEVTGYTKKELCSKNFDFMDLIAHESWDIVKENLINHLRGEEILPSEYKIVTKNGKEIIGIHNTKLIDYGGEKAILGIITDITERKKAERALIMSEGKYRTLFESMLEGFAYCKMIFDENDNPIDFVYLDVNDSFERLTGLKKEDVLGKKVTEAIPGIKESKDRKSVV